MKNKYQYIILFMIALGFFLELGVMTYYRNEYQYYKLPIIWILGSLLTGLGTLHFSIKPLKQINTFKLNSNVFISALVVIILLCAYKVQELCVFNPTNPSISDIIPSIISMAENLKHLKNPYTPIDFGYELKPGYLTMQYAPFITAINYRIDLRSWSFVLFSFFVVLYVCKSLKPMESLGKGLLLLLPFYVVLLIVNYHPSILINSIELLDAGYYLFFVYALFSRNNVLIALSIVFCLLSRFTLILWLPLLLFVIYFEDPKSNLRNIKKVFLLSVLGVLLLYVIPVLIFDPEMLVSILSNYNEISIGLWESIHDWHVVPKPHILTQGFSFAIFYNDFLPGSTASKIKLLQICQLALCGVVLVASGFFYFRKKKILNSNLFLLGTLKIFLSVFYGFLFAPFAYLYVVPLFIGFACIFQLIQQDANDA